MSASACLSVVAEEPEPEPERPWYSQSPPPDCKRGEPCAWVSCRYHLLRERARDGGEDPEAVAEAVAEARETCALDAAKRGERQESEMARLMGITRQAVWRLQVYGMAKVKRKGRHE